MTVRYKQSTFDAGEISPRILGRTDLEKWSAGVGTLQNFVCLAHGPAQRRVGTEYIGELRDSSEEGRLIPFEFSVDQAYMIVANNERFRFYTDGAVIVKTAADTAAWAAVTAYVPGDWVHTAGIIYVCHTGHTSSAAGAAGDEAGVGANWTTYWTQDDTYEVANTYAEADLDDIDSAQSYDTLYLAQPDHDQRTLVRSDHNDWTLADIAYTDGPFLPENPTTTTLNPSATTGVGITITASAIVGINNGTGFQSTDVGRLLTILHGATWGIAVITAVGTTTSVTATVLVDFGAATAQDAWRLGFWCDTTGFPRTVTFAFDRLCWGGSPSYPNYSWLSKVSEYTTHAHDSPLTDASALILPLSAGKLNAIRWLRFPRRLTVGTGGAEWWMVDATGSGPVTADSKQAVPASGHGSSGVKPVEMGNILVFLQKHGRVVRELFYEYENDSFGGDELSVLAEHLTKQYSITRMAFQRTPNRVLWCVRSDGSLLGCTYYRDHKVTGWHIHTTDGWFEDVAVIPGDDRDEVWFIVRRSINGSTVRYIERMTEDFIGTDTTDAKFLDSHLSLDGRKTIVSIDTTTFVVTVTSHWYIDGDMVRFRTIDSTDPDLEGSSGSLNNLEFEVSDAAAHTFKCLDEDGVYVDFSTYTEIDSNSTSTVAKNVTSITGLSHLEAEEVAVVADGVALDAHTVSSGAITLVDSASVVHVGLGYESNLWTNTPDLELKKGSSMSTQKRVVAATIQLYKTLGMQVGTTADNLQEQQFADDDVPAGQPAELFTGKWLVSLDDQDNTSARLYIRQDQALPMTVLAIESDIEIDEEDD